MLKKLLFTIELKISSLQQCFLRIYKLRLGIYKCRVQLFVLNTVFELVLASEKLIKLRSDTLTLRVSRIKTKKHKYYIFNFTESIHERVIFKIIKKVKI
jgi:hypothetical protein